MHWECNVSVIHCTVYFLKFEMDGTKIRNKPNKTNKQKKTELDSIAKIVMY